MCERKVMTVHQFITKANETIPFLKKSRYFSIELGLIPEANDGYWHHFIVSNIHILKKFEDNIPIETINGDNVDTYIGTDLIKIYKIENRLQNIYIDKDNDRTTYVIRVDNVERTYKDVVYRKWEFGKK